MALTAITKDVKDMTRQDWYEFLHNGFTELSKHPKATKKDKERSLFLIACMEGRAIYREEGYDEKAVVHAQKRRAHKRELVNDLTHEQWKETLEHFNHECAYCGVTGIHLAQEHVVPVKKDGGYTKNNIVPSCKTCNSSKRDRDMQKWYIKQPYYSEVKEQKILEYVR